jgi:hypothetical protein
VTQEYIGTKQVTAWPQEGGAQVLICGIGCKEGDEKCNGYCTGGTERAPKADPFPGYAVKYADGYTSWSPQDVFEAAYVAIGHVSGLPAFHQRLIGEKAQLDDRLNKLRTAINDNAVAAIEKVGPEEYGRLCAQELVMRKYSQILDLRITALEAQ